MLSLTFIHWLENGFLMDTNCISNKYIYITVYKSYFRHLNNFDLGGLILKVICIAEGKAAREHEHDIKKLMIEQSHNPNAMQAMLEYGKPKQKQIEGVKYEPVKRYILFQAKCHQET